jgi:hypothetical protein
MFAISVIMLVYATGVGYFCQPTINITTLENRMAFVQTTLDIAPTEIITADRTVVITVLYLVNTGPSAVTITVYLVPAGGVAGAGTILYQNLNCDSDQTLAVLTERVLLDNGDAVWAECSGQFSVVATIATVAV